MKSFALASVISLTLHASVFLFFVRAPARDASHVTNELEVSFVRVQNAGHKVEGIGERVSSPSETPANSDQSSDAFSEIADAIQNSISYPRIARRMGWSGKVGVALVIDSHGDLMSAKIVQSSGHDILDKQALEALQGWEFPPGHAGRHEIVISFILRK